DVTNVYFESGQCWLEIDGRRRRNRLHMIMTRRPLPFLLGCMHIGFALGRYGFFNLVEQRIRIHVRRNHHLQFIPEPLPAGGEVEEVSLNGVAIDEGNFPAGGMAATVPVAGFEQYGSQQGDFGYLTGHAVDLYPV